MIFKIKYRKDSLKKYEVNSFYFDNSNRKVRIGVAARSIRIAKVLLKNHMARKVYG